MIVTFGEKLFGPTKHILERATTRTDSLTVHLETEKGLAILHPADWATRASWILAINACFHKNAVRTAPVRRCRGREAVGMLCG